MISPVFILILLATFAYFVSIGALLPVLPRYITGPLGGDSVDVGLVAGALNLSALALNLWAGRLGDRRGRRLLIVTGGVLTSAAVAGLYAARSLPALAALRVAAGAGEALFFVGAASAINDVAPDVRRGEAVSYFSLALHAGIAVGPVVGEWLLGRSEFPAVWIVAAVAAAATTVFGTRLPDTRPVLTPAGLGAPLIHPAAVFPGVVLIAGGIGLAGFNAFVPLYALELGMPGSRFVFVTFSAILIGVRVFGARVPDLLGPITSARVALAGTAAGLCFAGLWRTPAGLFAGTAVFALGHSLLFPALLMLAVRRAPAAERARVVGTITSFLGSAFAVGPIALGALARIAGYPVAFLASAGVAVCGLAALHSARSAPRDIPQ